MKRALLIVTFMVLLIWGANHASTTVESSGNLCFYPKSFNFGYLRPGEKATTQFEVWACCGCAGKIVYSVQENCSWVEVNPVSGSSHGEKDTITVSIDTTGLAEGSYTCPIHIHSNNGEGVFTVKVSVANDFKPPSVKIVKPEKGWLYINDEKIYKLGFLTFVIGGLTLEIEAKDDKTKVEKVDIYIGNKLVKTDRIEPFDWHWKKPAFGRFSIKVVAYDSFSQYATDTINLWKLL